MFRGPLTVVLMMGVVFGFGGGIASVARHSHEWHSHECGSNRGGWSEQAAAPVPAPAAPPAIIQQQAPAPQVFIVMPGASTAQPVQVAPAQAAQ